MVIFSFLFFEVKISVVFVSEILETDFFFSFILEAIFCLLFRDIFSSIIKNKIKGNTNKIQAVIKYSSKDESS